MLVVFRPLQSLRMGYARQILIVQKAQNVSKSVVKIFTILEKRLKTIKLKLLSRTRFGIIFFGFFACLLNNRATLNFAVAQELNVSRESLQFSHTVNIQPISSMSGYISFVNFDENLVSRVTALMVIDGEFLAVPLKYEQVAQAYRGSFPTPSRKLSYRFQILLRDGRAVITRQFEVEPKCDANKRKIISDFQPQSSTEDLSQLLSLIEDEKRLNYVMQAIPRVIQEFANDKH
jgi:hypothetical protein